MLYGTEIIQFTTSLLLVYLFLTLKSPGTVSSHKYITAIDYLLYFPTRRLRNDVMKNGRISANVGLLVTEHTSRVIMNTAPSEGIFPDVFYFNECFVYWYVLVPREVAQNYFGTLDTGVITSTPQLLFFDCLFLYHIFPPGSRSRADNNRRRERR
jgi:hypothetical protein